MKKYKGVFKSVLKEIKASQRKVDMSKSLDTAISKFNVIKEDDGYFEFSQGILTGKFVNTKKVADLIGRVKIEGEKIVLENKYEIKFSDDFILGPIKKERIKDIEKEGKILLSGSFEYEDRNVKVELYKEILDPVKLNWEESKFENSGDIFARIVFDANEAFLSTRTVGKNTWFNTAYSYCPQVFSHTFDEVPFEEKPMDLKEFVDSFRRISRYYVNNHTGDSNLEIVR